MMTWASRSSTEACCLRLPWPAPGAAVCAPAAAVPCGGLLGGAMCWGAAWLSQGQQLCMSSCREEPFYVCRFG